MQITVTFFKMNLDSTTTGDNSKTIEEKNVNDNPSFDPVYCIIVSILLGLAASILLLGYMIKK